jgi:hypothetical protein
LRKKLVLVRNIKQALLSFEAAQASGDHPALVRAAFKLLAVRQAEFLHALAPSVHAGTQPPSAGFVALFPQSKPIHLKRRVVLPNPPTDDARVSFQHVVALV